MEKRYVFEITWVSGFDNEHTFNYIEEEDLTMTDALENALLEGGFIGDQSSIRSMTVKQVDYNTTAVVLERALAYIKGEVPSEDRYEMALSLRRSLQKMLDKERQL